MIRGIYKWIDRLSEKYSIVYYIRLGVFILLFICSIRFLYNIFKPNKQVIGSPIALKPTDNYKDKYDNLRSELEIVQISNKGEFKRYTDSFKKVLRNRSNITGIGTIVSKADTEFIKVPVYLDTDSNYYFIKQDNYVSIYGSLNTKTRETDINYQSFDTTTYIVYNKKRFLRSDIRTLNISNTNPYNTIVAGSAIELKERKVIGVIGPYIGYSPLPNKFNWGLAFTLNLIPIKTK